MESQVEFVTVIGLEVHAQVSTHSKMFCGCPADYFDAPPNTHVCPVCLGTPGVLPVINRAAVEKTVVTGMALHSEIQRYSKFDRKNYIYPDLMKGYQVSQYDLPIALGGWIDIDVDGDIRRVNITRVHLEEDTARLSHRRDATGEYSLVDVNRSGVPLMEIVGEPDLTSPREAREYLVAMRRILRFIGASDGNMEQGSFRCDANISQRSVDGSIVGPKVEIKNLNSFRSVERALEYEVSRQRAALERGDTLVQETRGWVDDQGITVSQRSKEMAHDYRYFPEPDLPPVFVSEALQEQLRRGMAELPDARRGRFVADLGLTSSDAAVLTDEPTFANYFETALALSTAPPRDVVRWMLVDLFALARTVGGFTSVRVTPQQLAEIASMVHAGDITQATGKVLLVEAQDSDASPRTVVLERGLAQQSDDAVIRDAVRAAIAANPAALADYLGGKSAAVGFLIGQTMKALRGQGNPTVVRSIMTAELEAHRS